MYALELAAFPRGTFTAQVLTAWVTIAMSFIAVNTIPGELSQENSTIIRIYLMY